VTIAMLQNISAELLVLRCRAATWILLGIWTALGVFFAYVIPYALDPEDAAGGVERFLPENLVGNLLSGFPFFGGVFALMLGVFVLGSEYGWDTLKTVFTQRPGRLRVLAAKLCALGLVLVPYVVALLAAGAIASLVIARIEDAAVHWPSAWLLARAVAAGWLILAAWAALGVLLGVATRGTSLAIGVGILYALVIEGLLSALADSVDVLEPLTNVFLRANGYSLATALGASQETIGSNGPGSYEGPFVAGGQAVLVLVALATAFAAVAAWRLRRRDVL
jgi:ABC-2 type transport system permease protein